MRYLFNVNIIKLGICFLLMFVIENGYTQDASVFERLGGQKIDEHLYIEFDNSANQLKYSMPNKDNTLVTRQWYPLQGQLFNITNSQDQITLYLKFYNPLRHTFKSQSTEVLDNVNDAYTDWASSLPASFISLTGAPLPTVDASQAFLSAQTAEIFQDDKLNSTPIASRRNFIQSVLLYQWILEYRKVWTTASADIPKVNTVIDKINLVSEVEEYLFGPMEIGGVTKSLGIWVKDETKKLHDAQDNYDDFDVSKTTSLAYKAKAINDGIKNHKQVSRDNLAALIELLTDDFDLKIAPTIPTPSDVKSLKEYSSVMATILLNTTTPIFEKQDAITNKFDKLLADLNVFTSEFNIKKQTNLGVQSFKEIMVVSIDRKKATIKENKFVFIPLKEDGSPETDENKHIKSDFRVAMHQSVVPFISASTIFSFMKFPNYTISTESSSAGVVSRVARGKYTRVAPRPVAFLNLLTPIGKKSSLFLLPQVGFGMAEDNILLPIGLGVHFNGIFSISLGWVNAITKELDTLEVDKVVADELTVKNDLLTAYKGSLYFSINFSLGIRKDTKTK
jgi:hypothetical protein